MYWLYGASAVGIAAVFVVDLGCGLATRVVAPGGAVRPLPRRHSWLRTIGFGLLAVGLSVRALAGAHMNAWAFVATSLAILPALLMILVANVAILRGRSSRNSV